MIANYHTHTVRCGHAEGLDEEYVKKALEAGLKILGFSDHTPYPFEAGYYSRIRMRPEELKEYTQSVLALRQKYAGQIQLPLGVEIEYFPQFWKEQLSMLRDAGVEYLLLGQHWALYEDGGYYSGKATDREDLLADYCRSVRDAMQTGAITYIAHPDIFHFVGDERVYQRHMRALCRDAKSCGMPLEINLHGIDVGKHYPVHRFWELAAQEGCQVVFGSDAHVPESLADTKPEAAVQAMVKELGLELLQTVPLQSF